MKTKSKAYLKAEQFRDAKHQGFMKACAKDLSCVVYSGINIHGQTVAYGYYGRAMKPRFRSAFKTDESRAKYASNWMDTVTKNAQVRTIEGRKLVVDDVLCSSWGYDQTNVDYYKVVGLIGKSMVEIVEIGQQSVEGENGYMSGQCIPNPNHVLTGDIMRKKAIGDRVKVREFSSAYKMEPTAEVEGVRIYESHYWSSYA